MLWRCVSDGGATLSSLAEAAAMYLRAGLTPLPVKVRAKAPTMVPWAEYQERQPSLDDVRRWWKEWPSANVGLVTGNGFLVLDLDGPQAEELLSSEGIELPFDAPRVRTGRAESGEHVWLRISKDLHIRPKVSLITNHRGSAVDIRCDGAMAMAPPSVHPSGQTYIWTSSWDGSMESIPMAPASLLELISKRYGADSGQMLRMADEEFVRLLSGVAAGERNHTCARLAGKLLQWGVPAPLAATILDAVFAPRCEPPMPMREVRQVVDSIARRHERSRAKDAGDKKPLLVPGADIAAMKSALQCDERRDVVPTPWSRLNSLLGGGFKAGEYILLGARPGTGKTAFALQCAWYAARSVPVLFISLEMSARALDRRMFAQMTGVQAVQFEEGSKSTAAMRALERIDDEVRRMLLRHSEEAFTVRLINEAAESMRDAGIPPGLIVVDYLQLLRGESPTRMDRRQQVEAISRDLVRLAKVWNCPLMVLSALSRPQDSYGNKGETLSAERPPTLASLRESGQLEHDADLVLLMHRAKDESPVTIVNVAKHRDGQLGRINMNFDGETLRFAGEGELHVTISDYDPTQEEAIDDSDF